MWLIRALAERCTCQTVWTWRTAPAKTGHSGQRSVDRVPDWTIPASTLTHHTARCNITIMWLKAYYSLSTRWCSKSANLRQGVELQPKVIQDSNPDFRINPDLDVCWNVVDSIPCQCQSFRRISWKLASDCMRNANNSPTIPYSAMVQEVVKWPGMCMWHWITKLN